MNFNSEGKEEISYDAIVVGTGISGGWAAKELCEKGLKTLVLERGRDVKHMDYPTASLEAWDVPRGGRISHEEAKDYKVQLRTGYTVDEFTKHWWVKDTDQPYEEVKPFDWIRGYHVGGRSLMWGRQSYRWANIDFEANAKEGIAIDWPIRYDDIAPWYDYVESYIGVSGRAEGLSQLPDGKFLPPMQFNCVEQHVADSIKSNYSDRIMTIGRTANLTQEHKGRGTCQNRGRCIRGCPFGAYFSSQASTLPAAYSTGNMTLRPNSIVTEVILDDANQKAKGVRIKDTETGASYEFFSKIVFLNASCLGTTSILMQSTSERFPDGMGNDSGQLGHNLMDHHFQCGASGRSDDYKDKYFKGRRPNGIYVPRFRNVDNTSKMKDFVRGYGYQGGGNRSNWQSLVGESMIGSALQEALTTPGDWAFGFHGFGEILPYYDNKVELNRDVLDKWGMPTLTFDCEIKENERAMREDMKTQAAEMCERAGLRDVHPWENRYALGLGIHEMGTARMGHDPKTSVLNKWNQIHAVKNVFVTDGACMTSAACVNPSLTYMALTARAADYAVRALNNNEI
ncbi:MAG: GMC family oxidoreductase [Saprospiraceae bacterium]|nr:GMC family oxidoreductase [Saprospiraceae bacterium]